MHMNGEEQKLRGIREHLARDHVRDCREREISSQFSGDVAFVLLSAQKNAKALEYYASFNNQPNREDHPFGNVSIEKRDGAIDKIVDAYTLVFAESEKVRALHQHLLMLQYKEARYQNDREAYVPDSDGQSAAPAFDQHEAGADYIAHEGFLEAAIRRFYTLEEFAVQLEHHFSTAE